ncbi:hypothetical protein [Pseudoduganella dura]|nr:hypothetical protein [Pseudoduganella dura]
MNPSDLHVGAVFQREWDSCPIRVIAFDDEQVMYDCWWPHIPGWGIDSLNRTISYYRLPLSLLLKKSTYLRTDEYTEVELCIHRPDLPFGFARFADLEWPSIPPVAEDDFPGHTSFMAGVEASNPLLHTEKLYLHPFGPKGSVKPGVLLESENPTGFTVDEVLWHAARLQAPHLREIKVTTGVGIYRSGIQRKLPSYYIWGAKSRMEE